MRIQSLRLVSHLSAVQRPILSTIRMSSTSATEPRLSAGEDVPTIQRAVESLMTKGWGLDEEKMGVKKTFYFKSYFKAVSFVNMIAAESAAKKHHAVMTVRIGSVDIHWTTHNPRGLSHKDINMAQHCDRGAELMGSIEEGMGPKCG